MTGGGNGVVVTRPDVVKRTGRVRPSVPIVEQIPVAVSDEERRRILALAAAVRWREGDLGDDTDRAGGSVRTGAGSGPAVIFEDHSEIPLFGEKRPSPLEYRPIFLAADGDVLVLGGRRNPDFEAYTRDVLRLGAIDVIDGCGAPGRSVPDNLAGDPAALARVVALARRHGELTVMPYLSTPGAWRLAAAVAERAGVVVSVLGPPATLAARVNDKVWLAERIVEVLGHDARPETHVAEGPDALVDQLRSLASRHRAVCVKVPDSAGGVGNVVLTADEVLHLGAKDLLERVWDRTGRGGQGWTFPLLTGEWCDPVVDSPSLQLWIPAAGEGDPVVEGVFSQVLRGVRGSFVGAAPTWLPVAWQERMATEGVRLGLFLQALGYFGRCSFDAVLAGDSLENARLYWVDGNGRWGGVSIAMTGVNRLTGDWERRPFVIVQRAGLQFPSRPLPDILDLLGGRAFRPADGRTGAVLIAPRRLTQGTGMNLMVLAGDAAAAVDEAASLADLLTGAPDAGAEVSAVA